MSELFEILPGRTYVLESDQVLTKLGKEKLLDELAEQTRGLHCSFVILDSGIKIAKPPTEKNCSILNDIAQLFGPNGEEMDESAALAFAEGLYENGT